MDSAAERLTDRAKYDMMSVFIQRVDSLERYYGKESTMKRRITATALTAVLLLAFLASCAGKTTDTPPSSVDGETVPTDDVQNAAVPAEEAEIRAIPRPILYSVRDKGRQLIGLLRTRGDTSLNGLYAMAESRSEIVATFISLLEMCSMGSVLIRHKENDYIVSFIGGDTEDILESMDYG